MGTYHNRIKTIHDKHSRPSLPWRIFEDRLARNRVRSPPSRRKVAVDQVQPDAEIAKRREKPPPRPDSMCGQGCKVQDDSKNDRESNSQLALPANCAGPGRLLRRFANLRGLLEPIPRPHLRRYGVIAPYLANDLQMRSRDARICHGSFFSCCGTFHVLTFIWGFVSLPSTNLGLRWTWQRLGSACSNLEMSK